MKFKHLPFVLSCILGLAAVTGLLFAFNATMPSAPAAPASIAQVTSPVSPTGSPADTLTASWRETWDPEFTHTLSTTRLPEEPDEVFFKRHIERVLAFRRFLRKTTGGGGK